MVIAFGAVAIACGRQSDRLQPGQIVQAPAYATDTDERCVDGVAPSFARIDHHGEPMGFNVNQGLINPSHSAHWQSIARHPYAGNFFYFSKNGVKGRHTSFRDCTALDGPLVETTTRLVSDGNLPASHLGDEISSVRFVGTCGPIG